LLLRDRLVLRHWPADVAWRDQAEQATDLTNMGRWQQAIQIIDDLGQQLGPVPELVYNRALLGGWLADDRALIAGLHAYATLDVDFEEAVEAEAVAQLLDTDLETETIDTLKMSYQINDLEGLEERLTDDKRIEFYEYNPQDYSANEKRSSKNYLLLDQPNPPTGVGIQRDQVPSVLAILSLHGRTTSHAERLELFTDRGSHLEETLRILADVGGPHLSDQFQEEVIGGSSVTEQALSWRWHFPDDTPVELRRQLLKEERSKVILERWPEVKRPALGGKTPKEAAQDEALKIPLAAAVLILEQGSNNYEQADSIRQLRQDLNLPLPPEINASENPPLLPLVRLPRVQMSTVTDENLVLLYRRALFCNAVSALRILCREIADREYLAERIPDSEVFGKLIELEQDPKAALDLVTEARQRTVYRGESTAQWDIAELELHMENADMEEMRRILSEIDQRHGEDPEVAAAIYQLLYDWGFLSEEDFAAPEAAPAESTRSATETSGIWTPGGESARSGAKKPTLWTPG